MSSKGNVVLKCRVSEEMEEAVLCAVASLTEKSPQGLFTVSRFIRLAIAEKLLHLARSGNTRLKEKVEGVAKWDMIDAIDQFGKLTWEEQ